MKFFRRLFGRNDEWRSAADSLPLPAPPATRITFRNGKFHLECWGFNGGDMAWLRQSTHETFEEAKVEGDAEIAHTVEMARTQIEKAVRDRRGEFVVYEFDIPAYPYRRPA